MFNTNLTTFISEHVDFGEWSTDNSVHGFKSVVKVGRFDTLILTVSNCGDGGGYYVVSDLIAGNELGDGMTPDVTSAKRDAVEFSKHILHQLWQENASDEHVKEQEIADFLYDCLIKDWRADPLDALAQHYRIEHKGAVIFELTARRHFFKTHWRLLEEDELVCKGDAPQLDEAKCDAEAAALRCLQHYAEAYATDRLNEIREAA